MRKFDLFAYTYTHPVELFAAKKRQNQADSVASSAFRSEHSRCVPSAV